MDKYDYASVEVGKDKLQVAVSFSGVELPQKRFRNSRSGHMAVVEYLRFAKNPVRVIMEATGVYYLDVAIYLREEGVEVMVLNPRVSRHYAIATLKRAKNDVVDAAVLLDYVATRPFVPFNPPTEAAYRLRAITRKIRSIVKACARVKCQLHAEMSTNETPRSVIKASNKLIAGYEKVIESLTEEASRIVEADPELKRKLEIVDSVPGVAIGGAVQILGELESVPNDLTARQLVAYAGLDPVEHKSGTSVDKKKGISKRGSVNLRITLYMAALSAVRADKNVKGFYEQLIARGKPRIVALVAVMRKLLHCISGMIKNDQMFDASKFYQPPANSQEKTALAY